ncbi:hypothetical protein [Hahella sp. HN01]|uniref:hypothetical protein n=1 Tax=Hahella sp. HN01 TaxID=2847262 RepID=UPI0020A61DF6|nr:hypothetical protein [Hahella sp. HN01]
MYSTRRYEFKHWTDLTIVDLSFVESPFFAASYAERCLNNEMKVSEVVGNLSGPHFRSAFGAFPGRGTPYFQKWKEDFVRLVERGDILLVFKDGKKPFSPIASEEDEGVFPTNSDPVLAERLIARANPAPPPPPMLNGLLKDIPSLNGNLWWESVPAERRNYLPPPSKRSETPEIAQAEPDEATGLTEDEREEVYREFWEAKKQGDASAILAMEEKLGDEFYHSLETGGGGPFGKYYAIPKERAELMLEGLRVIERGSPVDDVRTFDNKIRDIRKNLINASSDPIAARRSIEVNSLDGLSERVALEDVGSFVTEIPPRLGELEEIYAGAITAVVGHPALGGAKLAVSQEGLPVSAGTDSDIGLPRDFYKRLPRNTKLPLANQLDNKINPQISCGSTCGSLALNKNGITTITPDDLSRLLALDFTDKGVTARDLAKVMRQSNGDAFVVPIRRPSAAVDALIKHTSQGNPAIVRVETNNGGHFIIVDEILILKDGQQLVVIRNPSGPKKGGVSPNQSYALERSDFEDIYGGSFITTKPRD